MNFKKLENNPALEKDQALTASGSTKALQALRSAIPSFC